MQNVILHVINHSTTIQMEKPVYLDPEFVLIWMQQIGLLKSR